jgi:hypothetical protein
LGLAGDIQLEDLDLGNGSHWSLHRPERQTGNAPSARRAYS